MGGIWVWRGDIASLVTLRLMERYDACVKDFSPQMDTMRTVKDADEIERMRRASYVTDQIYYDIPSMLKPGRPIREIELESEFLNQIPGNLVVLEKR